MKILVVLKLTVGERRYVVCMVLFVPGYVGVTYPALDILDSWEGANIWASIS